MSESLTVMLTAPKVPPFWGCSRRNRRRAWTLAVVEHGAPAATVTGTTAPFRKHWPLALPTPGTKTPGLIMSWAQMFLVYVPR